MEVVRQFIDAKKLMSVMALPRSLQNSRLEVIVLPAESERADIRVPAKKNLKVDSIVDSLVGILPDDGRSLDDYRAERLSKYEIAD
ncbi:MAG: hypothetical protein LUF35_11895 [Lachnospiraceae bacterium]|nr:hypothetical protein [Lachnospiraceae bacterium]